MTLTAAAETSTRRSEQSSEKADGDFCERDASEGRGDVDELLREDNDGEMHWFLIVI